MEYIKVKNEYFKPKIRYIEANKRILSDFLSVQALKLKSIQEVVLFTWLIHPVPRNEIRAQVK